MKESKKVHDLDSNLEKILSVLEIKSGNESCWLTATDISKILFDDYGIHVHWKTISSILLKNTDLVIRRKRKLSWQFSILEKGREFISRTVRKINVIDPENSIQNVITFHDFLSGLGDNIRICDPYLDTNTIEHLDSCKDGVKIKLITHNIKDSGRLRQLISAFNRSKRHIEIKKTPISVIHDRYIIDDKIMLILGTSLNGFGKKQCFLIKAGKDIRSAMLNNFKKHWSTSNPWP
ncbi:MAG: hypothetical protein GTO45_06170 [Candidatus Aminicenantes bacterium]|nr:hypothetical protein [Candidatus Aminicenantes bacterium]NIM78409.1 hypothetical protein [Candidatus Aminicenantes bacterium]NIN17671.1 hypothetical protein [Candidatus Aminicenantes bacterium]NIN41547.1 hypothetical protein [Candidatus Aminicenantes bacterium]NIN84321.1 hypothetical protein [Candidatus Aminicenantes bacterium]